MLGIKDHLKNLLLLFSLNYFYACSDSVHFPHRSIDKTPYDTEQIIEKKFTAGHIYSETIRFDPRDLTVDHSLRLFEQAKRSLSTHQIERPHYEEQFIQGGILQNFVDRHNIIESGFLDLLIIIDDSQSMESFQDKLGQRFMSLLEHISNSNWRIAVATSSSSCLRSADNNIKILTRYDYDLFPEITQNRFQQLIAAGTTGDNVEKGIWAATEALAGDCGNVEQSWTRDNSQKAVLIVSDEKNCGSASNEGCEDEDYALADYFLNRAPSGTKVYGLFLYQLNSSCPNSSNYEYPSEYVRLVTETGGIADEICQDDYSDILSEISLHVSELVKRRFELSFMPNPGTLVVSIDGDVITEGYYLLGSTLELTDDPGDSAVEISIAYEFGGDDITDTFELMTSADQDSLDVYMDDQRLDSSSYQLVEGRSLQFFEQPQRHVKIDVHYRKNDELSQNFSFNWPEGASITDVLVDSKLVSAEQYTIDHNQQQLFLLKAPKDGEKIEVLYRQADAKQTVYKIPDLSQYDYDTISVFDSAHPEQSIAMKIENNHLFLEPDEVWDGRTLTIRIVLALREEDSHFNFKIPESALPGTILVKTLDGHDCNDHINIKNNSLHVYCSLAPLQGLLIDYDIVVGFTNIFHVDNDESRDVWDVYVNGTQITEYERENGNLIIPMEHLSPEDLVTVIIYPVSENYF